MTKIYSHANVLCQAQTRVEYTIPAGVAGFVDVDLSAALGAGVKTVWGYLLTATPEQLGARENGSAADSRIIVGTGINGRHAVITSTDVSGIIEVYRNITSDVFFELMGVFV